MLVGTTFTFLHYFYISKLKRLNNSSKPYQQKPVKFTREVGGPTVLSLQECRHIYHKKSPISLFNKRVDKLYISGPINP